MVFDGQEKNRDTIRIAKMNLAVHGLDGRIAEAITYYQDEHNLVGRCDCVMANPPFNVNLVDAEKIKGDPRLPEDELALFDLLFDEKIGKTDRERIKQASRDLLASLREVLRSMHDWTQNSATQAQVEIFIRDSLWRSLPRPPFTDGETESAANRVYDFLWQKGASGQGLHAA